MKYEYYDTNSTTMRLIWYSTDNKSRWWFLEGKFISEILQEQRSVWKCWGEIPKLWNSWRRNSEGSRSLIAHTCSNESGPSCNWILTPWFNDSYQKVLACMLSGGQYLSSWVSIAGLGLFLWTCTSSMNDVCSRVNRFLVYFSCTLQMSSKPSRFPENSHLCSNKYTSGFPGDMHIHINSTPRWGPCLCNATPC